MTLMKENEENKKGDIITRIIGILLLVVVICLIFVTTEEGYAGLITYPVHFFDKFSIISIVLFEAGIILVSGERSKFGILQLLGKTIIPVGAVISLATAVIGLGMLDDPRTIGPNLAVAILTLLYSCIIKIVVEILLAKQNQ